MSYAISQHRPYSVNDDVELLYDRVMAFDMLEQAPNSVNEYGLPLGAAIILSLRAARRNGGLHYAVRALNNAECRWLEAYITRAARLLSGLADRLDEPRPSIHSTLWGQTYPILMNEKARRRKNATR